MGPRMLRAVVVVTLAALLSGAVALGGAPAPVPVTGTALSAIAAEGSLAPVPVESSTGSYIVLLDDAPAATYAGGLPGLIPTQPAEGEKLDSHSSGVHKYVRYLRERQEEVAAAAEVEPSTTYQIVLNGFSAKLTPDAAARLAATTGVRAIYPDEIFRPDSAPHSAPTGLARSGATQDVPEPGAETDPSYDPADPDSYDEYDPIYPESPADPADPYDPANPYDPADPESPSDPSDPADPDAPETPEAPDAPNTTAPPDATGVGIVVGTIDTGIAPDNPSFAGDRLTTAEGGAPYLKNNTVVFEKADGREFRAPRVSAAGWTTSDYSTTLIGAQYFATGATNAGFDFAGDVLSPRDRDGHGSRVASIAIGRDDVQVSAEAAPQATISGIAPSAKIASYKACFVGRDALTTTDDICVGSDLLAALERAVADGVDVVNYSVGGGAAASGWAADDIAFYNAAVAGVFIAVSAGNAGPGASTANGGAPWYTTVAASSTAAYEATVRLSSGWEASGVSLAVPAGMTVTAPVVYAADAARAGAADANLCYLGTLDPSVVEGAIVVCDRGVNPRLEKSQEVRDAGGIGMILVNTSPGSLDPDVDSVPTVHLDVAERAGLLEALTGTTEVNATLSAESPTGANVATAQIAEFSGRGPIADGTDILVPDIAAPGVAILAATTDTPGGDPAWGVSTGTSIAAPHVAGLAARYLSAAPGASPDEVKSALMTTATGTMSPDGSVNIDPFAQGAGQVDDARSLDPGLLYLNGPLEWAAYARAQEVGPFDSAWVSSLNLASIVVGALGRQHTVSRTLTATRPGSYTVSATVPGVVVSVSPETLTFAAAGDAQSFTVTFANDSAAAGAWAGGTLTWTGGDGTVVRSPLAVRPATADVPESITVDGVSGSTEVSVISGAGGEIPLSVAGLAPAELLVDPDDPAPGHSGDGSSGDENGNIAWRVDVPAGSPLARFDLTAEDAGHIGLSVYRLAGETRYDQRWASATMSAQQQITLTDPTAGEYLVVAAVGDGARGAWDLTAAIVDPRAAESLAVAPSLVSAAAGASAQYSLTWAGLRPETRYLGVVSYGESEARTIVQIDAGAPAPVVIAAPVISGTAETGEVLTVDAGTWNTDDVTAVYQWARDGRPITGATTPDYRVRDADVGTALSVRVTVTARGGNPGNPGSAVSDAVIPTAPAVVEVEVNPPRGDAAEQYRVTVGVRSMRGDRATGSVTVSVGDERYTGTLADGEVTFTLRAQKPGTHVVAVEYSGAGGIADGDGRISFVVAG